MLGPKTMPERLRPAWEIFSDQAERVQAARRVVLSCLPVGRVERAPVPVGLGVLADELAALDLGQWRVPELERQWRACREAVDEALAAVPAAVAVAETTSELEDLLGAVSDVLEPLGDAFSGAERAWLSLRERRRRGAA